MVKLEQNPGYFARPVVVIRRSRPVAKSAYYCYGEWQDGFRDMKDAGVQFHEGIPELDHFKSWFPKDGLLALDDLIAEGGEEKALLDLFTKHSHHQNITVLYLCQDMFPPGKYAKSISRNAHYIAAFKNPRDQLGIRNLLLQSFPTQWQEVLDTFRKVTDRPNGYMLLDLHPASQDDQRVISRVLKDEGFVRCHQFTSC